ncbi:PREDICTED: cytochrome P450 1A1-like [Branchiostoma belcheri]|uniref:unspecific monooxygenase n=1 Tax=Branchiostoma belcheri TaxID=7741 RepID=A0A6P4Z9I3_BRABE|nr:PREDICTED: cytochrome P450 1A1-like [Branchiostoma belcheri]
MWPHAKIRWGKRSGCSILHIKSEALPHSAAAHRGGTIKCRCVREDNVTTYKRFTSSRGAHELTRADDTMAVLAAASLFGLSYLQVVLVAVLLVLVAAVLVSRLRQNTPCLPPGPWGFPVVGIFPALGSQPHHALARMAEKYGDVFRVKFGSRTVIILNGIDMVKEAFVKQAACFAGRPALYSFKQVKNGITFKTYSPTWVARKKVTVGALKGFVYGRTGALTASAETMITEEAQELVRMFLSKAGQPCNPELYTHTAVANVVCALCFGKRYEHGNEDFRKLLQNTEKFRKAIGAGNPVDFMPWLRFFPNKNATLFKEAMDSSLQLFDKHINFHLQTYDRAVIRDITDALIFSMSENQEAGLSADFVLECVIDIFGAGQDTSAQLLHWCFLYMLVFPDVQARVQRELDGVVGRGRLPTLADESRLPYTAATVQEIVRHTGIVPMSIPHLTTKDTQLNGYTVPKDTIVFANLWSVGHDRRIWGDPSSFRPERFLDPTGTALDAAAVEKTLPFSAGKRRCPGEVLARQEMFLFFSILLHQCTFERVNGSAAPSLEAIYGLVMRPQPYSMIARPR